MILLQGVHDLDVQSMKGSKEVDGEEKIIQSRVAIDDKQDSVAATHIHEDKEMQTTGKSVPPPGDGQRIYEIDPLLRNHQEHLDYR